MLVGVTVFVPFLLCVNITIIYTYRIKKKGGGTLEGNRFRKTRLANARLYLHSASYIDKIRFLHL